MRKITDFIVKSRFVFLSLFIILALFSLYLEKNVNINDDIMKYLPKTSETKKGKDIMEKEFKEINTSTLECMFKDLSNKEKENTLKSLENIPGVSSVSYDNTKEYNIDNYTLYVLNVNDYADSKLASNVYNYVLNNFKTEALSGTINDANKPVLPTWIVILAIVCAIIILIILSDSYLEPILYLTSIGIAIFINKGTNIFFPSVSEITDSITAILQLALSMDYSIMLTNRYKQEKKIHKDKIEAMKEALYHSVISISSSSITTIVGLIALVFMSFTIGKDLGFVLAKGVLLSLISIFFCLPALLLVFDDLIKKTKKKAPKFDLSKLGNFMYKTRYISLILIVVLFIGAYFMKGNINILYTDSKDDKIGKVFGENNQIAIVYNNKYEELMSSLCTSLESNKKIDQVLCYSNTINEKLKYNELNNKFEDLGENIKIDDELLKIIYYNYYEGENNKMTISEFISFIKSHIYNNAKFNQEIDQNLKNNIDLLENFTNPSLINKKRAIKDIASILSINEKDAEDILIYYNSKYIATKMTITDFVNFMLNDVYNDSRYSKNIDSDTYSKLRELKDFTDINVINKEMNAEELANIFGMDKKTIEDLFLFYRITNESDTTLTIHEFTSFALDLANDNQYKDLFTSDIKDKLTLLNTLSDDTYINKSLEQTSMMSALNNLGINIDSNTLNLLYTYYTGYYSNTKLTLKEFADFSLTLLDVEAYKSFFSTDTITYLNTIKSLSEVYNKKLSNEALYKLFGINENIGNMLDLAFTNGENEGYEMTPLEFVQSLLNKEEILKKLPQDTLKSLQNAYYIMSNMNTSYSSSELASILKQDNTTISFIYGLYDVKNNKMSSISLKSLINFLYNNKTNALLKENIEKINEPLNLARKIVNNTNKKYDYKTLSDFLDVNKELLQEIYGVYDYQNKETFMNPLDLTNLILDNKDNELLANKISNEDLDKLSLVKNVMNSSLNKEFLTPSGLNELLRIDNENMSLLFSLYNFKYIKSNNTISLKTYIDFIVNDVMNNKDYASNFNNKKNKINTVSSLINNSLKKVKYNSIECFTSLNVLNKNLDKSLIDLIYMYNGSINDYDDTWKMTLEEFVNYLNKDILNDNRFNEFLENDKKEKIIDAKESIENEKELIVSDKYSRVILNTSYESESKDTFKFINSLHDKIGSNKDIYVVGNSSMAVEMNKTFNNELNKITMLTMIFIFVVVAITYKDLIIPLVLVLIIETAVYVTMSAITLMGGSVYFISLLIVQAILMGATIDYAIVYTSYYLESRQTLGVKNSIINAYNKSIHTIISSSSILIIVTLIVALFASLITSQICKTISEGTIAAVILILLVLPGVLAASDKFICRKGYYKEK